MKSLFETEEKSKTSQSKAALIPLNELLGCFFGLNWIDPCINESETQVYQGDGSYGDTKSCGMAPWYS